MASSSWRSSTQDTDHEQKRKDHHDNEDHSAHQKRFSSKRDARVLAGYAVMSRQSAEPSNRPWLVITPRASNSLSTPPRRWRRPMRPTGSAARAPSINSFSRPW